MVRGGFVAVELTNEDGGWHPHLHIVCDCYWLSCGAPPPPKGCHGEEMAAFCKAAAKEIGELWAKQLGDSQSSVRIKRAVKGTIAKEVTKYTVKSSDLLESPVPVGDLIRALDKTRAYTTFGEAHGQKVKGIRQAAIAAAKEARKNSNKLGDIPDISRGETDSGLPAPEPIDFDEYEDILLRHGEKPADIRESWDAICSCKSGAHWLPRPVYDMLVRSDGNQVGTAFFRSNAEEWERKQSAKRSCDSVPGA